MMTSLRLLKILRKIKELFKTEKSWTYCLRRQRSRTAYKRNEMGREQFGPILILRVAVLNPAEWGGVGEGGYGYTYVGYSGHTYIHTSKYGSIRALYSNIAVSSQMKGLNLLSAPIPEEIILAVSLTCLDHERF